MRVIDQMVTRADEVAASVAKDGVTGARGALKGIARDLRKRAAEEFAKLPMMRAVPESSPEVETEDEASA